MTELSRLIEHCKLMDVSQLEQELACKDDHTSHHRELLGVIRGSSIKATDKLRLALLYALRYEDVANLIALKRELVDGGVKQEKAELVDLLLRAAGKARRTPGLYGDGSLISRMAKNLQTGLTGVENVFTQHVPRLISTLDAALKGKLKEAHFPCTGNIPNASPRQVIVFVIGGVTYEEATKVAEINGPGLRVILGGTTIHNSNTFLSELRSMP